MAARRRADDAHAGHHGKTSKEKLGLGADGGMPDAPQNNQMRRKRRQPSTSANASPMLPAAVGQEGSGTLKDDEDEADEADDAAAAGAGSKKRRRQHRDSRRGVGSPASRKRSKLRERRSAHSEEPISDFDLDGEDFSGDDEEENVLKAEAKHLVEEYEKGLMRNQSGTDILVSWETMQQLYRAPLEDLLTLAEDANDGDVISSMWYENMSTDDESEPGSELDADTISSSSSAVDIDEAADQYFLMKGLGSDSDDSDSQVGTETDAGDTTDSLDDGDETALVRFGIEVDQEDANRQHLEASKRFNDCSIDPIAFAQHPDAIIRQTARELGIDRATAAKILADAGLSVKGRRRREPSARSIFAAPAGGGEPEMGEFVSAHESEKNVVIDTRQYAKPSPFSARRSNKRVRRRMVDADSPSDARPRRQSIASASSQSFSRVGGLDEDADAFSFSASSDADDDNAMSGIDLNDVLHDAVIFAAGHLGDGESEMHSGVEPKHRRDVGQLLRSRFDDLDRWDRVPIGAFRSSRVVGEGDAAGGDHRRHVISRPNQSSPVLVPVKRATRASSGLNSAGKVEARRGPGRRGSSARPQSINGSVKSRSTPQKASTPRLRR